LRNASMPSKAGECLVTDIVSEGVELRTVWSGTLERLRVCPTLTSWHSKDEVEQERYEQEERADDDDGLPQLVGPMEITNRASVHHPLNHHAAIGEVDQNKNDQEVSEHPQRSGHWRRRRNGLTSRQRRNSVTRRDTHKSSLSVPMAVWTNSSGPVHLQRAVSTQFLGHGLTLLSQSDSSKGRDSSLPGMLGSRERWHSDAVQTRRTARRK